MVDNDFSDKLRKIKVRNKRAPKIRSKITLYLMVILIILIVIVSFIAYNIYQTEMTKKFEEAKKLEEAKTTAINSIRQMFLNHPDDPYLSIYISNIKNSGSKEEINRILNDAMRYIELRKYKDRSINNIKQLFPNYSNDPRLEIYINNIENCNSEEEIIKILEDAENYFKLIRYKEEKIRDIKNLYGRYYFESLYAQSVVSKIQNANSVEEIDYILNSSNIEEDARLHYIKSIESSVYPNKYYTVPVFGKDTLMSGKELVDYIKKLSLSNIKNLTINPVSFNKVAIVVPATHCGKIPFEGSKVEIYDRENVDMKPILGVVDSSYVIVNDIRYSETKNVSSVLSDDVDSTTLLSISDIKYSLENIPGVLYATAAEKLDYYKVIDKFGKYGEKFNKITSDTQIFDEDARYLLIVSVSSDDIPKLLSIKDVYIARIE